jgi:hypothetical protein
MRHMNCFSFGAHESFHIRNQFHQLQDPVKSLMTPPAAFSLALVLSSST